MKTPKKDYSRKGGNYSQKPRGKSESGKSAVRKINADLWGFHAVREAWLNPAREITALYVTEQALTGLKDAIEVAQKSRLVRPEPEILDRKSFDKRLPQAVHQGVAVEAAPLEEVFVTDLIARASLQKKSVLVMLDQVTDPHNIGAILRSASAFAASGLIMQTRHSPGITPVLAKSASGAVEHIPIAYETNLGRAVEQLQEAGFKVLAFDERGTVDLPDVTTPEKTVILLGAEGKGLRQSLQEQCDMLVRLPTSGAIGSLNVSNAAAVALYALAHR